MASTKKLTPFMLAKTFITKSKIRGSAQRLFMYLAVGRCNQKNNSCKIAQDKIKADTGMDIKTIKKATDELISKNWLRKQLVSTDGGRWVYRYTIYDSLKDSNIPSVDGENSLLQEGKIPHDDRENPPRNRIGSFYKEPIIQENNLTEEDNPDTCDEPHSPWQITETDIEEWRKQRESGLDSSAEVKGTVLNELDNTGQNDEDDQGTDEDAEYEEFVKHWPNPSSEVEETNLPESDNTHLLDIIGRGMNLKPITCEEYRFLLKHRPRIAKMVNKPYGCD